MEAAAREQREQAARRARIEQQQTWVDLQLRQAVDRGEFDALPGLGKPLSDLGDHHDPDWWVKRLVEREQIRVLPPALQLRRDDAALDDLLDSLGSEAEVRRELGEFNDRVRRVLYSNPGGPPVVTPQRDVEAEVARWRERRRLRREAHASRNEPADPAPRRGWLRRGGGRGRPWSRLLGRGPEEPSASTSMPQE